MKVCETERKSVRRIRTPWQHTALTQSNRRSASASRRSTWEIPPHKMNSDAFQGTSIISDTRCAFMIYARQLLSITVCAVLLLVAVVGATAQQGKGDAGCSVVNRSFPSVYLTFALPESTDK